MMQLDGLSAEEVVKLELATGLPVIYNYENGSFTKKYQIDIMTLSISIIAPPQSPLRKRFSAMMPYLTTYWGTSFHTSSKRAGALSLS